MLNARTCTINPWCYIPVISQRKWNKKGNKSIVTIVQSHLHLFRWMPFVFLTLQATAVASFSQLQFIFFEYCGFPTQKARKGPGLFRENFPRGNLHYCVIIFFLNIEWLFWATRQKSRMAFVNALLHENRVANVYFHWWKHWTNSGLPSSAYKTTTDKMKTITFRQLTFLKHANDFKVSPNESWQYGLSINGVCWKREVHR